MMPATIIREAQSDGVTLTLSTSGTIKATGDVAAVSRWLAVIREHKSEIIDALKCDAVISWGWLLHFSDRDILEVHVNPARSRAEILVQYPEALAAEPLPERPAASLACSDCFGYRRHGESGYCCARPDLPPAYGERHPLRLIPDAGACEKWWPRGVIPLSESTGDLQ